MNGDYCRRDDVFVGYAALGVAKAPEGRDSEWLRSHCWVCGKSRADLAADPWNEAA